VRHARGNGHTGGIVAGGIDPFTGGQLLHGYRSAAFAGLERGLRKQCLDVGVDDCHLLLLTLQVIDIYNPFKQRLCQFKIDA
jgi:hypothetical protein